ncbi:MAG: hydantoinase/oxoprolinase family protein, partial [Rickettsiales bacterium]
VPRDMRLEVPERTLADGSIHTPVDIGAVKAAAANLRAAGAEAVAIVFVNSYANPANERAAAAAVRTVWENEYVEISSDILPEIREFERTSTTVLNAYLQPTLALYFTRLETALKAGGFDGQVLIVQSNGGVMTIETARRRPIRTALSGPAAGVMASAHIAGTAGYENVITCDMGGTSFDVSLVAGGKSALAPQTAIDFGMVVRTPMIEITTIGAGGGSIAWVDRGGLLQVGPESAGSDPGPVCYGLGNDRPTVTDANLVLGRINADRPIGGKLDYLDAEAAGLAIERYVGAPIQEVGLAAAVVPRFPGINSALGCVIADMRHDFVQTVNGMLPSLDLETLGQEMAAAAASGLALLDAAEVVLSGTECVFELDMSYQGQTHTLDVTLPVALDTSGLALSEAGVRMAFESRYRELYGRPLEGLPERVLNFRVAVVGHRPKFDLSLLAPDDDATLDKARSGSRRIWVDGGWHDAAIFARLDLPVGAEIAGPAILEQPDTTILIEPGLTGTVDAFGNLIVRR